MSVLQFERLFRGKPVHTGNPYLEAALSDGGSTLALKWRNQTTVRIPAVVLRRHCQCKRCRQTPNGPASGAPAPTITGATPLGVSALRLVFSDGHDSAPFPWTLLWTLCCPEFQ